jgi:hypothetical protein
LNAVEQVRRLSRWVWLPANIDGDLDEEGLPLQLDQ